MPITLFTYLSMLSILFLVIISLILSILLFKRFYETKLFVILLLLAAILLTLGSSLLELFIAVGDLENVLAGYYSASSFLFGFLGIVTAGFFLLFIDYFENEHISPFKAAFSASSVSIYFTPYAIFLAEEVDTIQELYTTNVSLIITLTSLIVPVFLLYVLISSWISLARIKTYAIDKQQISQLSAMQLTIVFFYGVTLMSGFFSQQLIPIGSNTELEMLANIIIPKLSVAIGALLLWRTYATTRRITFLQPQRMDQLLVISHAGLPFFEYSFRDFHDNKPDSALLSGGITAIKSILKEAVGTKADIKAIKFLNKEVMISSNSQFSVFLIVDRPSSFLRSALSMFTDEFAAQYGDEISENSIVTENNLKNANDIIANTFGL